MEVKQKIESKMLCSGGGEALRLDYCLLARLGEDNRMEGPFGMEIALTGRGRVWREQCRNLTGDYRRAVALIHVFAANGVTPVSILGTLRGEAQVPVDKGEKV